MGAAVTAVPRRANGDPGPAGPRYPRGRDTPTTTTPIVWGKLCAIDAQQRENSEQQSPNSLELQETSGYVPCELRGTEKTWGFLVRRLV